MTERRTPTPDLPEAGRYEIRLTGHLDARWTAWFDGLTVGHQSDGTTVISGPIPDQAAQHGVLQRVRDLRPAARRGHRAETDQRVTSGIAHPSTPSSHERTPTWLLPNEHRA